MAQGPRRSSSRFGLVQNALAMAAARNMEQALTQLVDAGHGEGDVEAEAVKARITEETGKLYKVSWDLKM